MLLSVIIVHYRVPLYLAQCLYSLEVALAGKEAEIIVVDNDSQPNDTISLINRFTQVRWIAPGENIGFAAACNLGWRQSSGQYILFLNPDTLITAQSIDSCLGQLIKNNKVGAVGCRLVNGFGYFLPESKRSLPSLFSAGCKLTGLSTLFPRSAIFNQYAMGNVDSKDSCAVEVLTGAYLLVLRKALDEVEGFDEAFFLYGEDVDFCRRMGVAGYSCWYEGGTTVIHFKGASSRERGRHYFNHFYRAMMVYCNKYYPFPVKNILQAAIFIRQQLHWAWSALRHAMFPQKSFLPDSFRFTLVSNGGESKQLIQPLLESYHLQLRVEEVSWATWISNSKDTKHQPQPSVVVFCIDQLSLDEVVNWRAQNPDDQPCYYWYVKSDGLVGPENALSLQAE
ncbi:MAG: glycosyltransferase family 2 protein [Bacteroidetes bacterium]|nr:glycosyltransferase family 2 protein [Bacteroidota bacterium]